MSYKDFSSKSSYTYTEVKDWEKDTVKEKVNPIYNDGNHEYYLSLKDVIEGINTSKYPVSGENVWLPDSEGNLIPLPEWIGNGNGSGSGGSGSGGAQETKHYRVEMISTQGNIIKDKDFTTTLKAIVYENNEDVTDKKDKKYFKWARFSGATEADQIADAQWNLKWAAGAKEIPITADDVNRNAMFQVQFVTDKQANLWMQEAYKAYINKIKK